MNTNKLYPIDYSLSSLAIASHAGPLTAVEYSIDEKVVASRSFSKGKWSCGKDGLTITTLDRSGVVLDKFPIEGRTVRRSTIYRLNEYVFIKTTDETMARAFCVVPRSLLNVAWFRFAERPK